jgi:hypothetical protein
MTNRFGGKEIKYISGKDNDTVVDEIKTSTEVVYPSLEGKLFVNIVNVVDHVRKNDSKYTNLNYIKSDRYLKAVISEVYLSVFKWNRFTQPSSSTGPVYRRTDRTE